MRSYSGCAAELGASGVHPACSLSYRGSYRRSSPREGNHRGESLASNINLLHCYYRLTTYDLLLTKGYLFFTLPCPLNFIHLLQLSSFRLFSLHTVTVQYNTNQYKSNL